MNLHSGIPYWLVRNGLLGDYPALHESLLEQNIVIIGSGISGAFVAHELCSAGFHCTMIDRRMLSLGSSVASTAHLNYEIDLPLFKLAKLYGEADALKIYQSNIDAVSRVGEVLKKAGVDAAYQRRGSLYLASGKKGSREIETEFVYRAKLGLPVELLDNTGLRSEYGINRLNAIRHSDAAQIDPYRAASGLIQHYVSTGALRVSTRTEIVSMQCEKDRVLLKTANGPVITAAQVICAPGYEARAFLPKRILKIASTYALVTQPIAESQLWPGQPLIWETARPYLYVSATADNRIMIGGFDKPFKNELLRDALLQKTERKLLDGCSELFPHLDNLNADFSWCGSFAETKDSLPYIGEYPGMKRVLFALGYAGNGTTFSLIAAEIIRNKLTGVPDDRARLFRFDR